MTMFLGLNLRLFSRLNSTVLKHTTQAIQRPACNRNFATRYSSRQLLSNKSRVLTLLGAAGVGIASLPTEPVHSEAPPSAQFEENTDLHSPPTPTVDPPLPKSSVNLYELSFGTVCGICAGVFIIKGVKTLAFLLGGVFVMLQYFGYVNIAKTDWSKMGTRFENLFYTKDAMGNKKPPNVASLWSWMVDFLTANFQQRASFLAGLALGIRLG